MPISSFNPISTMSNLAGSAINTGGQALQAVNNASANLGTQSAINDATGDSKAVDAQRAESAKNDANQAALIGMQGEETRRKQTQDVLNAIQAGKDDSSNKMISSVAQNAKGISF